MSEKYKSGFDVGDSVWLYMTHVKPVLTKKLGDLWNGQFRILEKGDDFSYKLHVAGTAYRVSPLAHISRLKPHRCTQTSPVPDQADGLDLDEAILPKDSWEPDREVGEYDVEKILDVRRADEGRTRGSTRQALGPKEYLVKWSGFDDP